MAAVDCYTLRGRCVCVFGVKSGDLCGSEGIVEQGVYWHSDACEKWWKVNGRWNFWGTKCLVCWTIEHINFTN